ncbi:MAG: HAD family hydrolase [Kiritimatiellia bacterium]
MHPYLLWDWNGTLLDDTQACLDALNAMLRKRGVRPITRAYYRAHFAFPVRPFYASIGVKLEEEDWDRLAQEYHDTYHARPLGLNAEARRALELARTLGCRQSIISALRQDLLERATARFGVAPYMEYVYGTDNLDGGSKISRARELLARIRPFDGPIVLIGDALHDKEVADDLGIRCVLFSGGGHSRERLAAVAPTEDSLIACVRRACAR